VNPAPLLPRRRFLRQGAAAGAAAVLARAASPAPVPAAPSPAPAGIIDTHVTLFRWPFRRLKYDATPALVAKLRRHRITEAWAGSHEALLHKDLAGVNARLAAECRAHGDGLLRPFGSVNLAWPDWEDDLRRCHEEHQMPGVRLFPGYQTFDLTHPDLGRLVQLATERGLIVQIVFQLEDPRVHHPLLSLPVIDARPLVPLLERNPSARVQLLHFAGNVAGTDLRALVDRTNAWFEFSRWEGNGRLGQLIQPGPGSARPAVPAARVLFGSHAPYFPVETGLLRLFESPLDAETLHALMHRNARRLLPA
jgi:predicted TIM-barrel fold metal-dependent hydrolase